MSKMTDIIDKSIVELIVSTKKNAKQIAKNVLIELLSDTPTSSKKNKKHKNRPF